MWEKLNNSSLLFNKSFIQAKKHLTIYSDRIFFNRIYFYFVNKGYFNIIINSVVNLIISNFLVFFIIFIINCVSYDGIISINKPENIETYIDMSNFFNIGIFLKSILVLFLFLDIIKIISLIDDIYIYSNIRKFFNNNLKIKDTDLEYLEWNNIIEIYKETQNIPINPYYINSIITLKDNYFISLIDNKIIKPIYLNGLLEWNIIYGIIYSIVNNKEQINNNLLFENSEKLQSSIKTKIRTIALLNMTFMPIIFVFQLLFNLFSYGELFYNKPDTLISGSFTKLASWKFRNFNEPYHEFIERKEKIEALSKKYSATFKNKILEAILKCIIFILSSIFITLLIITLVNDSLLTNLNIVAGKNLLWFFGILCSVIAIIRGMINTKSNESPSDLMDQISQFIIVDDNIIKNANLRLIKNKFLKQFQFKIIEIVYDILSTLLIPIQLWSISYDTKYIVYFLKKITIKNDILGYTCTFSNFENNDDFYGSQINDNDREYIKRKKELSKICLNNKYPSWTEFSNVESSIQINII